MNVSKYLKLFAAIIICELAGIIGSLFTIKAIPTWYTTLAKPALNPPSSVFAPVWTILYTLMGTAAFLIYNKGIGLSAVKIALGVFAIQLALNTSWSIVFFGLESPKWAFINIVAMWIAIVATIVLFYKLSKPAAYLLIPYLLWVTFAAYLNYSIWVLN